MEKQANAGKPEKSIAVTNKNITDDVLTKVNAMRETGLLRLPEDYSPENALKGAYIILQDVKDKEGKPALQVCSKDSIALSLFKMITEGLNPLKKQGSFIVRAGKLCFDREYDGDVALAKRAGLEWIRSRVIYEGDIFTYSIDPKTALVTVVEHKQELENIDVNKIRGAYATYSVDGVTDTLVMTMVQIRKSWMQGAMKGNSPAHNNFPDAMAMRTVERRVCKPIIRRSDDSYLEEAPEDLEKEYTGANKEELSFTDVEEIANNQPIPEKTENPVIPENANPPDAGMEQAAIEFEQQENMKYQKKGPGF
jgi:recombination protein RecT